VAGAATRGHAIAHPSLRCEYGLVPWDSDAFGFPVAQISGLDLLAGDDAIAAFATFEHWRDEADVAIVYARLRHEQLRESMFLESRGFRFVEVVYRRSCENVQALDFADDGIALQAATESDLADIDRVARAAFTTGRYALDFRIDPRLNGERYVRWARGALAHPSQRLVKASAAGATVGFFVIEDTEPRRCYWHLTAVAPGHQGAGFGRRIWRAVLMMHRHAGIERVDTTVSGHNLAVLNLYAGLGFRFTGCETTLHWVRADRG